MSLKCCNKRFRGTDYFALKNTDSHSSRLLEFGVCPSCGVLIATLHQKNKLGQKDDFSPKKRKVKQFISDCEREKLFDYFFIEHGSKQNMSWLFNCFGIIKDFNNKTRGNCNTEVIHNT